MEREGKMRRVNMQQEEEEALKIEVEKEVEVRKVEEVEVEAEESIRLLLNLIDQVLVWFSKIMINPSFK